MTQTITAHFDGKVLIPDGPVQLPVGPSLRIQIDVADAKRLPIEATSGIRDEDWPTDPEGIARLVKDMDSLEPLQMTPEEEDAWRVARESQRQYDESQAEARINRIQRSFQ